MTKKVIECEDCGTNLLELIEKEVFVGGKETEKREVVNVGKLRINQDGEVEVAFCKECWSDLSGKRYDKNSSYEKLD